MEKNEQFLNYQKQCKEKQLYLNCWVSYLGVIHCHCLGNPKAAWNEERDMV